MLVTSGYQRVNWPKLPFKTSSCKETSTKLYMRRFYKQHLCTDHVIISSL